MLFSIADARFQNGLMLPGDSVIVDYIEGRGDTLRALVVTVLPKVQVDIVVSAIPVRDVIETAKKVLYTGHIGDGKIFVYDVENVIKVRTGEEGYDALQDVE